MPSSLPSADAVVRHRHEHEVMSTTCSRARLRVRRLEPDTNHAHWHQWQRRRELSPTLPRTPCGLLLSVVLKARLQMNDGSGLHRACASALRTKLVQRTAASLLRCRETHGQHRSLRARLARFFGKANRCRCECLSGGATHPLPVLCKVVYRHGHATSSG